MEIGVVMSKVVLLVMLVSSYAFASTGEDFCHSILGTWEDGKSVSISFVPVKEKKKYSVVMGVIRIDGDEYISELSLKCSKNSSKIRFSWIDTEGTDGIIDHTLRLTRKLISYPFDLANAVITLPANLLDRDAQKVSADQEVHTTARAWIVGSSVPYYFHLHDQDLMEFETKFSFFGLNLVDVKTVLNRVK